MPLKVEVFTAKDGWTEMGDLFHVGSEPAGFSQFKNDGRGDKWVFKNGGDDSKAVVVHSVYELDGMHVKSRVLQEEIVLQEGESYVMELRGVNILKHRFTQVLGSKARRSGT